MKVVLQTLENHLDRKITKNIPRIYYFYIILPVIIFLVFAQTTSRSKLLFGVNKPKYY